MSTFRLALYRSVDEACTCRRRLCPHKQAERIMEHADKEQRRGAISLRGLDERKHGEHMVALVFNVLPTKPKRKPVVRRERWRGVRKPKGIERFAQGG